MSSASQFFGGGALPVGSIIQSPYNLNNPAWLLCDGRKVLRSAYPLLSDCLASVGTFTGTSRTKPAFPYSSAICNDGTNWIMAGNFTTGNAGIQTTPDGITYTQRTTNAENFLALLYDGVNVIASTTGFPQYSTNGGVTWNVCVTGGSSSAVGVGSLARAPSLGTVGRLILTGGTTTYWTSDNRGVSWVARTSPVAIYGVAWTGSKYIGLNGDGSIITSSDGISWVIGATNVPLITSFNILSDGAGKVLLSGYDTAGGLINTSLDHGVTWTFRRFDLLPFVSGGFSNGRFFIHASAGLLMVSSDLVGWAFAYGVSVPGAQFSYKSGVYLGSVTNSVTNSSLVEDGTKMYLPFSQHASTGLLSQSFIKAL